MGYTLDLSRGLAFTTDCHYTQEYWTKLGSEDTCVYTVAYVDEDGKTLTKEYPRKDDNFLMEMSGAPEGFAPAAHNQVGRLLYIHDKLFALSAPIPALEKSHKQRALLVGSMAFHIVQGFSDEASHHELNPLGINSDKFLLTRLMVKMLARSGSDEAVKHFSGALYLLRERAYSNSKEIAYVEDLMGILKYIEKLNDGVDQFISKEHSKALFSDPSIGAESDHAKVYEYGLRLAVRYYWSEPMLYDETFLGASDAFQKLFELDDENPSSFYYRQGDFCGAHVKAFEVLSKSVPRIPAYNSDKIYDVNECKRAREELLVKDENVSARTYIEEQMNRVSTKKLIGKQEEQNALLGVTTYPIEKLYELDPVLPIIEKVWTEFLKKVSIENSQGNPRLIIKAKDMKEVARELLITNRSRRLHYQVAIRAVLEFWLKQNISENQYQVLIGGQYYQLRIELEPPIGLEYLEQLKKKAELRKDVTGLYLPIGEGALALLGLALLTLSKDDVIQGTGSGLAGVGVGGLSSHLIFNEAFDADNRWLAHGVGALVGGGIGFGMWCLFGNACKSELPYQKVKVPDDQLNDVTDYGY